MKIEVDTFEKGTTFESVLKVVEEANEMKTAYIAWDNADFSELKIFELSYNLKSEIGDVLTATMNLCSKLKIEPQECVDMVQVKNILRGYYDTIE